MHTAKIKFELTENGDFEKTTELIDFLLGAWRMNGQLSGREFPLAKTDNCLEAYVSIPDFDSLTDQYNNKYVDKFLAQLRDKVSVSLKINILGEEPVSAPLCKCKKSGNFILYTTYVSLESVLRCFSCFGIVPLYKIPKTYDDEYYNIICWQSDYQSCDSLQMNCMVGERFAVNQISKYDSQLTRLGLAVCQTIEEMTGKRVYYYLAKVSAKSYQSELERKCPNCGGKWLLKKPLHGLFNFKCQKCRLLSEIAWNAYP